MTTASTSPSDDKAPGHRDTGGPPGDRGLFLGRFPFLSELLATRRARRAVSDFDLDGLKAALDDGANPNARLDVPGRPTLLMAAATANWAHAVRPLVAAGADMELRSGPHNRTPLFETVANHHHDMARVFLAGGARLDSEGEVESPERLAEHLSRPAAPRPSAKMEKTPDFSETRTAESLMEHYAKTEHDWARLLEAARLGVVVVYDYPPAPESKARKMAS